jgi:hypothetical protein
MRINIFLAVFFVLRGVARAAESSPTPAGFAAVTPRETLLAICIAIMMALGLGSFFLLGRIAERTHVALALLAVLIGAFSLFTLYGLAGREDPAAGALVVFGLIGLFKLMNQFEIRRKSAHDKRGAANG